ncbi:MAG TPA: MurR/RpiR family transcriptional regulator [Blastocatellia bacterium]|nr:MurR/RpiR family transcriptional regulator [Blastocatellia bacterium]
MPRKRSREWAYEEAVENNARPAPTPLEVRFAQARPQLTPRRQQLIRAVLDNPEETFFLSSRELARRYRVDAATIVRTIQALGYERFADFAADLRRHFMTRVTPYTVMKAAAREKRSISDHIRNSLDRDGENLSVLTSTSDTERVTELARLIHRSRRILVIGVDLAASLAWFLGYGLSPLGFDAEAPVGSAGNLQHKVDVLTQKDLVIAISFGRCLRETVETVLRAKQRGVTTFGITDSDTTPIATYCDGYLVASIASPSITGSYVAPMALINTILVACAHIQPKRSLALLRKKEDEYKTGPRWYRDPPRRNKTGAVDEQKGNGSSSRPSRRKR